jgi:hydroxyacyl-ACP dehydratase HTD2-like protein with hotdog domain
MDLIPEIAARLRIHARGRLVQQQQLRVVQQTGREREALLPAAGERAGQLIAALREAERSSAASTARTRSGIAYTRATKSRFS